MASRCARIRPGAIEPKRKCVCVFVGRIHNIHNIHNFPLPPCKFSLRKNRRGSIENRDIVDIVDVELFRLLWLQAKNRNWLVQSIPSMVKPKRFS